MTRFVFAACTTFGALGIGKMLIPSIFEMNFNIPGIEVAPDMATYMFAAAVGVAAFLKMD